MPEDKKKDERKWVGVRISKKMMHQVEDIIDRHPEFAYNTPNDFIRDATRRHLEYVISMEIKERENLRALPSKVESIVEEAVGQSLAKDFDARMKALMDEVDPNDRPEQFMDGLKKLLAATFGPTMAETITKKIIANGRGK